MRCENRRKREKRKRGEKEASAFDENKKRDEGSLPGERCSGGRTTDNEGRERILWPYAKREGRSIIY